MSEHTPGPWRVVGLDVQACDARRTIVAQVTGALSNPTANADRRLIAAAPDLLDAVETAFSWVGDPTTRTIMREAIATARGTSAPASEPRSGEAS